MIDVLEMECCGLRELHGVSQYSRNFKGLLWDLATDRIREVLHYEERHAWGIASPVYGDYIDAFNSEAFRCGAFIFTQAGTGTYGDRFAEFLTKHELGEVHAMPSFTNRNTGKPIKTFLWVFDLDKVTAWWTAENEARKKKKAA